MGEFKMKEISLVQPCLLIPVKQVNKKFPCFGNLVDYGAYGLDDYPTMLRSMEIVREIFDKYELRRSENEIDFQGNNLFIFTPSDFGKYEDHIPENEEFYYHINKKGEGTEFTQADLWWDLENCVFFSFKEDFMKALPAAIQKSFKLINKGLF